MDSSRRNLIGAMALAPLATCAAQAVASGTASEITTLCADYTALSAMVARHPLGDTLISDPNYKIIDADHRALLAEESKAYKRVLEAPMATTEHIALKLQVFLEYSAGCVIDEDELAQIISQVQGMAT